MGPRAWARLLKMFQWRTTLTMIFSPFTQATPSALMLGQGFLPSTLVETPEGWRLVGTLTAGDRLVTAGHEALPLVAVERSFVPAAGTWAMHLPAEAFGNRAPLHLAPGQRLLVEGKAALPHCGDIRALVPALALEGWRGVEPHVPLFPKAPVMLRLIRPALIHAGPGLWLACAGSLAHPSVPDAEAPPELPLAAARQLVAALMCAEAAA